MKTYPALLALPGLFFSLVCLVLPVFAVSGLGETFRRSTFSTHDLLKILAPHVPGPLFLIALESMHLILTIRRKRIPRWELPLFALGSIFTALLAGRDSHDFGHVVFRQCSEIYGQVVGGIALVAGVFFVISAWLGIRSKPLPSWEDQLVGR